MATQEDEIRAQVLSLFSACNNDLRILQERIVRSLQQTGRHDVKLDQDGAGSVMVVSQSKQHARGHMSFKQQLDEMHLDKAAKKAQARIGEIEIQASPSMEITDFDTFRKREGRSSSPKGRRTASAGGRANHSGASYRQHLEGSRRCFKRSEKDLKREAFPTSKFTGNYILQRYGGAFPPHGNYGFYRRYGLEGRGAASAEYHNFPNGERPDPHVIYQ